MMQVDEEDDERMVITGEGASKVVVGSVTVG